MIIQNSIATKPYFWYFTDLIVINWACITLILNIAIIANILTLNVQVSTSLKRLAFSLQKTTLLSAGISNIIKLAATQTKGTKYVVMYHL